LDYCVKDAAQNLNVTGKLVNKTKIRTELTNINRSSDTQLTNEELEELKANILSQNDRIEF